MYSTMVLEQHTMVYQDAPSEGFAFTSWSTDSLEQHTMTDQDVASE